MPRKRGQCTQRQPTQSRNLKNINETDGQEIESPLEEEDEIETIDPEPTIYITELMEDWNKLNQIERNPETQTYTKQLQMEKSLYKQH